ncbi:hypothetical protein TARUN_856 [Trichoderma arundinaceum]|uniref:Uncharacterized protein n=1 Tax=Trichoderma arundinaceum TaxID=490622 RepID=A0A395NZ63_TRIAR|nr:hypothetical protein TARUN_856 [Trichoderma arundinaceum]
MGAAEPPQPSRLAHWKQAATHSSASLPGAFSYKGLGRRVEGGACEAAAQAAHAIVVPGAGTSATAVAPVRRWKCAVASGPGLFTQRCVALLACAAAASAAAALDAALGTPFCQPFAPPEQANARPREIGRPAVATARCPVRGALRRGQFARSLFLDFSACSNERGCSSPQPFTITINHEPIAAR